MTSGAVRIPVLYRGCVRCGFAGESKVWNQHGCWLHDRCRMDRKPAERRKSRRMDSGQEDIDRILYPILYKFYCG